MPINVLKKKLFCYFGVLKMGRISNWLIDNLNLREAWNTNINTEPPRRNRPNLIVHMLFFGYVLIYIAMASIGGIMFFLVLSVIKSTWGFETSQLSWMIFGLIFGISFSFFLQSIPSPNDEETPAEISRRFRHYFTYYLVFLSTIIAFGTIFMYVVMFLD